MAILTVNSGSSSIKLAIYDRDLKVLLRAHLSGLGHCPKLTIDGEKTDFTLTNTCSPPNPLFDYLKTNIDLPKIDLVGHRIVHGGLLFDAPTRLDEAAMKDLATLVPLAPQHQPQNLCGVRAAQNHWPHTEQIGLFDTAFHRSQPRLAQLYALPLEYEERAYIRYGFHGLSYEYIAGELRRKLGEVPPRTIVAHLGSGCSMAALKDGKSIATTMGFSALDGLPMATRSGSIDPGLVLHLMEHGGQTAHEVSDLLYHRSGLRGISGLSGDMRVIAASKDPEATLARDYFIYHCIKNIGALAAVLEGCDLCVFTGGIGENDEALCANIMRRLEWLSIKDWMQIPTDEELIIAQSCVKFLPPS